MTDILSQLSSSANGAGDTRDVQLELEAVLGLPDLGIAVTSVKWYGSGQSSSIDIDLSNGETMKFARKSARSCARR